jgi:hypothetical protein
VVCYQLYPPAALPPEKEPRVPSGQETEWTPEPFWTRWRRGNNPCLCRESKPLHPARRSVLTLTVLTRIICSSHCHASYMYRPSNSSSFHRLIHWSSCSPILWTGCYNDKCGTVITKCTHLNMTSCSLQSEPNLT